MAAPHDDPGISPDDDARADDEVAQRWAEIVADLGTPADGAPAEPADPDPARDSTRGVTYPVAPWVDASGHRPPRELSGRDWAGSDQIDAAEAEVDAQEHFVPPDPGPVLGGDPLLTMAWFGAAGMPIAMLILLVVWPGAPPVLLQGAAAIFLLSCALLVWRLPRHRPDSDNSGAVV